MQKLQNLLFLLLFFVLAFNLHSCRIALNDYDVDPSVKTFSVDQFETSAGNAQPTIGQQFSEQLKQRVLNDTKLSYQNAKGDLEFSGAVTSYQISSIATKDGTSVSLQRLTIRMNIDFRNNKQEGKNWSQSFHRFADFGADVDLSSVEDQLTTEIYTQVIEDVFNKAFANW